LNYTRVQLKPNCNRGEGVVSGSARRCAVRAKHSGQARNRAAHVQQQSPGLLLVEPTSKAWEAFA